MLISFIALSQARIRKVLADEEAAEIASGEEFPHKVTAAVFVQIGLELEDQQ